MFKPVASLLRSFEYFYYAHQMALVIIIREHSLSKKVWDGSWKFWKLPIKNI